MLALIWTTAMLTVSQTPPPAKLVPGEDAGKPKLIAKGEGYFIHALPPLGDPIPYTRAGLGVFGSRTSADGPVILHTSAATGEMKILAVGMSGVSQGPPMGMDRLYYGRTVIAGVATDKQRLYVLQWHAKSEGMAGPITPRASPEAAKYRLLVFGLDDGKLSQTLEVKEGDFPKILPRQTAGRGPLQLRDGGVACFGVIFTFEGTRLLKQQYEKKP